MVAVHRIPGQPEAGRTERVPGRGKHAGHGGETVPGTWQVIDVVLGMPVALVGHLKCEQLLGPVAADDADRAAQRRVKIGEAVEQLSPAQ